MARRYQRPWHVLTYGDVLLGAWLKVFGLIVGGWL
jgi:hypothetical protein